MVDTYAYVTEYAPLSVGGADAIDWLLLDRFTTARLAGAVDGTPAEPGPGTRDDSGLASIAGGELVIPINGIVGFVDAITRVAGTAFLFSKLDSQTTLILNGFNDQPLTWTGDNGALYLQSNVVKHFGSSGVQLLQGVPGDGSRWCIIARATGYYFLYSADGLTNWALLWVERTATDDPIYAGFRSGTNTHNRDDAGVVLLDTANATLYPTPTLSDTFSDVSAPYVSDGLAHVEADGSGSGVTWNDTSGQWSNSANKAYIDADGVAGPELLVNNDFAAWTGDDPDGWTVSGEVGADPEVSEVDSGQLHGGTNVTGGNANLYTSATNIAPQIYQDVVVIDDFFIYGVDVGAFAGVGTGRIASGALTLNSIVGTGTVAGSFRAVSTRFMIRGQAAPVDFTLPEASLKLLTFADALRAAAPASSDEPFFSAALTITDKWQAGIVINLDSYTSPQNCIHVWCDRVDAKIYAREMVAGVWQADALAGVAFTYSAGTLLEVRRIGNDVYVFYNGAYIGNFTTTIPDTSELTALFATDNASYFEDVTNYPTNVYDYGAYV